MARPAAKPALAKAPTREHPVAPVPAATPLESPAATLKRIDAPADQSALKMFSARIDPNIRRRTKLYSVQVGSSLQEVTEAALTEYMDNHPPKADM